MVRSLNDVWRDGGDAVGAWLSLRDPFLAEVAATAGYDYVCIDMQHGLADLDQTVTMLHAMARRRPCRSCACRGTNQGSSDASSTPARSG